MELDWSTFLLEVINFLILVWLLKRFLYQPVLNVIEQRRQRIEAEMAQAYKGQQQAQELQQQYEARLKDWEQEKRSALDKLELQLVQERDKRMQQLDEELQQHRVKQQARAQQQQSQWRIEAEAQALQLGAGFVTRLLQSLSGPELDQRLYQLFMEQMEAMSETALAPLRESWQNGTASIDVVSATHLDEMQQQALRRILEQKLGPGNGEWRFSQDQKLIAGLRVSIGGWVLQANLQDELRFFVEAAGTHE